MIFAFASTFTLTSSIAWAQQKNSNSAKSNTSTIYPVTDDDCSAIGGEWLISEDKTFCYLKLQVTKDGQHVKFCQDAGGTVVNRDDAQYCEPTDPALAKLTGKLDLEKVVTPTDLEGAVGPLD